MYQSDRVDGALFLPPLGVLQVLLIQGRPRNDLDLGHVVPSWAVDLPGFGPAAVRLRRNRLVVRTCYRKA